MNLREARYIIRHPETVTLRQAYDAFGAAFFSPRALNVRPILPLVEQAVAARRAWRQTEKERKRLRPVRNTEANMRLLYTL